MKRIVTLILLLSFPCFAKESKPQNAWSALKAPFKGKMETIGGYSNGCLVGAEALPLKGVGYESIRRYRKRYYGHPHLIEVVKWIGSANAKMNEKDLLIGDLSQIGGGPMPYGHRSHQLGLDADIWFTHQPEDVRNKDQSFPRLVDLKAETIKPKLWSDRYERLLKTIANHPKVERIFVNWIIKRHLCSIVKEDRNWLRKIRPWWGHDRHFHVRIGCPPGSPSCKSQSRLEGRPPCGGELWFSDAQVLARRKASGGKVKPKRKKTLPARCLQLLNAQ